MRRHVLWVAAVVLFVLAYYSLGLGLANQAAIRLGVSYDDAKTITEILRSLVETGAIIIAGVWAYERFIKAREDYPYPNIQHRIQHVILDNGTIYLSVFVKVTNEGKAKLDLSEGQIYIRQVLPLPQKIQELISRAVEHGDDHAILKGDLSGLFVDGGQRLAWMTLGSRRWGQLRQKMKELEPGQMREIQFDFILLEKNVKVIEAISYFEYAQSSWELATLYFMDGENK